MDHDTGRACHETYIPTQQHQTQADPRLQSSHGNEERPTGVESSTRQGSSPVDALARAPLTDRGVAAPQRFSRDRRLTQAAEFARVFAHPLRSSDRLFTVVARDNGGRGPRLGLAISKRAAKRAVERNRLKRVAREVFRLQQQQLPSSDFVVLAGIAARGASREELRLSLEQHFRRLSQRRGPRDDG